ncbi:hypothetical protein [Glaciimonas immobilis]|uniref:Uncharacterized protein n=1 Tax=Glaciimonas immobilis TaxID=728004 RepID=A0A840S1A3_9BURK|nr:hypothetical protein [Glaciimonas immobilis]KAF3996010.1 hypothetical protein HAV38_21130 [Glaciimonas immobilis]MBB5202481.1 hypothetical protein [Glaciimonas immobilis]
MRRTDVSTSKADDAWKDWHYPALQTQKRRAPDDWTADFAQAVKRPASAALRFPRQFEVVERPNFASILESGVWDNDLMDRVLETIVRLGKYSSHQSGIMRHSDALVRTAHDLTLRSWSPRHRKRTNAALRMDGPVTMR